MTRDPMKSKPETCQLDRLVEVCRRSGLGMRSSAEVNAAAEELRALADEIYEDATNDGSVDWDTWTFLEHLARDVAQLTWTAEILAHRLRAVLAARRPIVISGGVMSPEMREKLEADLAEAKRAGQAAVRLIDDEGY